MKQYEVTFVVDPVLSVDEVKSTAQTYIDWLQQNGCKLVHVDEMGLRQLAYQINRRSSGFYYCIEFQSENGDFITKFELALQRDERVMRYLTISLDKFGIKYNQDKRDGKIGKKVTKKDKAAPIAAIPTPTPVVEAPPVEVPHVEVPKVEVPTATEVAEEN